MPGSEFEAFASYRVRGAMLDELRRLDAMPRRARTRAKEVARARTAVEQRSGSAAEDTESPGARPRAARVSRDACPARGEPRAAPDGHRGGRRRRAGSGVRGREGRDAGRHRRAGGDRRARGGGNQHPPGSRAPGPGRPLRRRGDAEGDWRGPRRERVARLPNPHGGVRVLRRAGRWRDRRRSPRAGAHLRSRSRSSPKSRS